ncbi:MAG: methylated-DNA--[protein]-cysteine S-methyltransferase [Simkania sp.]|nr:methylated-DNA--[protein]-cysteine S-methyltransferase [Simkania sp.]
MNDLLPQVLRPEVFFPLALHLDLFCTVKGLKRVSLSPSPSFSYQFHGDFWNDHITAWLSQYVIKQPVEREFPLDLEGLSEFQNRILTRLDHIAFSSTCSYAEVAGPRFARAVGSVCNKNPWPLFIGCHRVIASSGMLGGFAYGHSLKQALLTFEKPLSTL